MSFIMTNFSSITIADSLERVTVERHPQFYSFDYMNIEAKYAFERCTIYNEERDEENGYTNYNDCSYSEIKSERAAKSDYGYRTIIVNGNADILVFNEKDEKIASILY